MNILIDKLPDCIEVEGEKIKVQTDFKVYIKAMQLLEKKNTKSLIDVLRMVVIDYNKINNSNVEECIGEIIRFIGCRRGGGKAGKGSGSATKYYDFEYDSERIYAAFFQQYNIDLLNTDMHWFCFKALFDNLTEDTQMVKAMQYRTMDLSGIKDRKQREFYRKKKESYKLPLPEEDDEYRLLIEDALINGGDISKIVGGGVNARV